MDNKYIKEKSRYVYIRERSRVLKEKPKAAPLPLKHMAIQEARQQATQSRQEENSYAVDKVENSTIFAADKGGQALKRARQEFAVKAIRPKESAAQNLSHRDTNYSQAAPKENPLSISPGQINVSHRETHLQGAADSKRQKLNATTKEGATAHKRMGKRGCSETGPKKERPRRLKTVASVSCLW